ncbi:MAG: hypothetical protein ACTSU5_05595 [Promethearchaeota archaeon]
MDFIQALDRVVEWIKGDGKEDIPSRDDIPSREDMVRDIYSVVLHRTLT